MRAMARVRSHLLLVLVVGAVVCALAPAPADAQSLSTLTLEGAWSFSLVSTPLGVAVVNGDQITSYRGDLLFNGTGTVQGGSTLTIRTHTSTDSRTAGGSLSVGPDGTVQGTLT